jgi:hypothetical protein
VTTIVNSTPPDRRGGFAWYPALTWPYESAWSLLHKFCRWNVTMQWDVWRHFGHASAVGSFITERVNNLVLLTPGWIDTGKFEATFRRAIPFDEPGSAFASHFIGRAAGRSMVAVCSSSLRYCPVCLAAGYHSTLFQIRQVVMCPVHAVRLHDRCISCQARVPYRLPRGQNPAYGCGCGREFAALTPALETLSHERVGRAMRELALTLAAKNVVRFRLAGHPGLL